MLTMGEINLPRDEQDALASLDLTEVARLIDNSIKSEASTGLRQALWRCGPFVAEHLRSFDKALEAHQRARAAAKREQTAFDVHKEASDLRWAVQAMRDRVETERKNGELFYVDDAIFWPRIFSPSLSVRISYRWRRAVEDDWNHGSITFVHQVERRPDYMSPQPRRPLSRAKKSEALQESLALDWQHLMRLGLYSVRDYFLAGRDGSEIPKTFKAVPGAYDRELNNFSCDFWGRRNNRSTNA